jgi:hypothetical protein
LRPPTAREALRQALQLDEAGAVPFEAALLVAFITHGKPILSADDQMKACVIYVHWRCSFNRLPG